MLKRFATTFLRGYAKTIRAPRSGQAYTSILVHSIGGIGNTLMATPLIGELRRLYPDARIDLLTSPGAAALQAHNPHTSNVLVDPAYRNKGLSQYVAGGLQLFRNRYDAAFHTLNTTNPKWLIRSILARVPMRVGHRYDFLPKDDFSTLYTTSVPHREDRHDGSGTLDVTGSRAAPVGSRAEPGCPQAPTNPAHPSPSPRPASGHGWP